MISLLKNLLSQRETYIRLMKIQFFTRETSLKENETNHKSLNFKYAVSKRTSNNRLSKLTYYNSRDLTVKLNLELIIYLTTNLRKML